MKIAYSKTNIATMCKDSIKAIIFDVDGTIADTEKYGHLPASNDAMRALGLPIQWQWDTYKTWINTIPGNVNRLVKHLTELGYSTKEITQYAYDFAPLKKSIYIHKYLPQVKLRDGIVSILKEIVEADLQLAIVSTSYESQIKALLQSQLPEFYPLFNPILGKESGRKTENNGFLFKKCLSMLELTPEEALVIEDSQPGLDAALDAGIFTAIFHNDYTKNSLFEGARIIAPSIAGYNLKQLIESCYSYTE